jgi:hypothetical protein
MCQAVKFQNEVLTSSFVGYQATATAGLAHPASFIGYDAPAS